MRWPWQDAENDLAREFEHHRQLLIEEFERQGLSPEDAAARAKAEFGGLEQAKEECREIRWWSPLAHIGQDIRFGLRMLRRTPAITVAAVLSLALGIGATTSILSLADVLIWRSLPVPAPQQLEELFWTAHQYPDNLVRSSSGSRYAEDGLSISDFFSRGSFDAMREAARGKADITGYLNSSAASTSLGDTVSIAHVRGVTGNFFSTLRLDPYRGRVLSEADDQPDAPRVVVLSHRYWTERLGQDESVLGKNLRVNNANYVIAGILPARFQGISAADATELYIPLNHSPAYIAPDSWYARTAANPKAWWIHALLRRAEDVSSAEIASRLDVAFAGSWSEEPKSTESTPHIRLTDASQGLGGIRRALGNPLYILLGLVGLVLIVVCANIANLLLARSVAREKEVALRVSVGCGRRRLVQQFLTESVLLALLGGLLAVPCVYAVSSLITHLVPGGVDGIELTVEPDLRTLLAIAAVTISAAILFGLYPALRASRVEPGPALKEGAGAAGTTSRHRWAPAKALVLVQVSFGVLLIMAAFLFTSQLNRLIARDAGFDRGNMLLFDLRPGEIGYEGDRLKQFYVDLERRLNAIPGVAAAGFARVRPLMGGGSYTRMDVVGSDARVRTALHHGSPSFLDAHGIPLVEGRAPTENEILTGAHVALVSEEFAGAAEVASALGLRFVDDREDEYEVIGVVQQSVYARMQQTPAITYLPFDYTLRRATAVLRTASAPTSVVPAVEEAVRALAPNLPLVSVVTMEQQISRTLQAERLFAWLCGSFGVIALVLCVVGLYGLMSHTTARRTAEMGIRIALGASRRAVTLQVLREAMLLAAVGMLCGAPLALYAAQLGESSGLLTESPFPYATLASTLAVLGTATLFAALAPALRAAQADPMQALRRG